MEYKSEMAGREGIVNHKGVEAEDDQHRHQGGGWRFEVIPLREGQQGGDEVQSVLEKWQDGLRVHLDFLHFRTDKIRSLENIDISPHACLKSI